MTEEVFAILRTAVTIAKERQIRKVDALRKQLLEIYPSKDTEVQNALAAWGDYVRTTTA